VFCPHHQTKESQQTMSTKVLGYFDTSEAAEEAENLLTKAGFNQSDIKIQSFSDKGAADSDHYAQSLAHGQSLLIATVSGNVDEDKAIHILRQSEAVKINEIETRYRSEKARS
jgi:hypothetical protein